MYNNTPIGFMTHIAPDGNGHRVRVKEQHFIGEVLSLAGAVWAYHVHEHLTALFSGYVVLETNDGDFDPEEYAKAAQCTLVHRRVPHSEVRIYWNDMERRVDETPTNTWMDVTWQGHHIEVLKLTAGNDHRHYIIAESDAIGRGFFAAVCAWEIEVHDEVLVFQRNQWTKDEALFKAIKGSRFDNLVLRAGLKEEILADTRRFFTAGETYASYGVPWKRGLLFSGPPGNGKTHTIKALVNSLGQACLYVKSFQAGNQPDEYGMNAVFARARATAPCVLVFEDLDALVTDRNRSFFLNEMDGFAANGGLLTVASTNHPERLDAAIVQRPSRFDRTYRFDLPALPERTTYIEQWNEALRPELRLSTTMVVLAAESTDNFSFAYLKELFVSATMRWLDTEAPPSMDDVIGEQITLLRQQMLSPAQESSGKKKR